MINFHVIGQTQFIFIAREYIRTLSQLPDFNRDHRNDCKENSDSKRAANP